MCVNEKPESTTSAQRRCKPSRDGIEGDEEATEGVKDGAEAEVGVDEDTDDGEGADADGYISSIMPRCAMRLVFMRRKCAKPHFSNTFSSRSFISTDGVHIGTVSSSDVSSTICWLVIEFDSR